MPLQLPVALSWIDQVPDRYAVDAVDSCPLPPQEVTSTSAIEQARTADELRTVTPPEKCRQSRQWSAHPQHRFDCAREAHNSVDACSGRRGALAERFARGLDPS